MLRIGSNQYELVRSQSGFMVTLHDSNHVSGPQAWQLDLHYVPAETNPRPRPLWQCEYLELCFQPFRYQTADWRELSGFGPGPDLDPVLFNITLGNLLAGGDNCPRQSVCPGEITITHLAGYHFRCQFSGSVVWDDREYEMETDDEISFTQATVDVPVNARDTLAAARAIARREIQLADCAGQHVTLKDCREQKMFFHLLSQGHSVTLLTLWREQPA
jgi:hypothetical protein